MSYLMTLIIVTMLNSEAVKKPTKGTEGTRIDHGVIA